MKTRIETEALTRILDSPSYREFIRNWIVERSKVRRFGFADIARNGNFSARSFPRDVVQGTKRLTPRSLSRFTAGMGLKGDLAAYFKLLVERDEPDCRTPMADLRTLERMRYNLRGRMLAKTGVPFTDGSQDALFRDQLSRVYAGLGSPEKGAKLAEIASRTGLHSGVLRPILVKGIEAGWVKREKDRYFPSLSHINLEGLSKSAPFKQRFIQSALKSATEAEKKMDSSEALFFTSTLSVRASDLPHLKKKLRNLLVHYVDAAEFADGERVVELTASLT